MWLYVLGVAFVIVFGAWCISRVRAEYRQEPRLSNLTVVSVWMLYSVHFVVTAVAATTSYWPFPLGGVVRLAACTLLISAGAVLFVGGIVSFHSFRRMSGMNASKLVTTGIYRWSRNPQNVGWTLFLLGVAVAGRSGLGLLMAGFFWATFLWYVPAEEEFLERIFGQEYLAYKGWSHRHFGPPRKPAV